MLAILPMAGMFEMGLRSATSGSNYDKARTLANLKMEEAKNLPVSRGTVEIHMQHIISKLGVSDRTQAAVRAIEARLLPVGERT